MEEAAPKENRIARHFAGGSKLSSLLIVVVLAILLGSASGFFLASKSSVSKIPVPGTNSNQPNVAQTNNQNCKDFAEGTIQAKPAKTDYSEGTHSLVRDGALPVALTSSVVDLSQYENKKVKVFGETQKALKEGWLMDVCRVEESK